MPYARPSSPYDASPPEEIPLAAAPLVRVLAQIRHPGLTLLVGDQGAAAALEIARRLNKDYPIYQAVKEAAIVLSPDGIREDSERYSNVWRLRSSDESWQVSITSEFVALETSLYSGRADFHRRLRPILEAYTEVVKPPISTRIGIRYTNRVDVGNTHVEIADLIQPELRGSMGAKAVDNVTLVQSFSHVKYQTSSGGSTISWGLLPASAQFDISIEPLQSPSWFLDIDVFTDRRTDFAPDRLVQSSDDMALRAYTHFRWAVTDKFLTSFKDAI